MMVVGFKRRHADYVSQTLLYVFYYPYAYIKVLMQIQDERPHKEPRGASGGRASVHEYWLLSLLYLGKQSGPAPNAKVSWLSVCLWIRLVSSLGCLLIPHSLRWAPVMWVAWLSYKGQVPLCRASPDTLEVHI